MFIVGQKVICINDNFINAPNIDKHNRLPVKNEILTIREINRGLVFIEIATKNGYSFRQDRFKPLIPKEDLSETTYEDIMEIFLVPKSL